MKRIAEVGVSVLSACVSAVKVNELREICVQGFFKGEAVLSPAVREGNAADMIYNSEYLWIRFYAKRLKISF